MKPDYRRILVAVSGMLALFVAVQAKAELSSAELSPEQRATLFAAAGFTRADNGDFIRCAEEPVTASYQPGRIELADLNDDGRPEAWVTESSVYCYGHTAEYFVLLTEAASGWRLLIEEVGIPVVLDTRQQGWPDIEVGGPGFAKFPVYRWNGKAYVRFAP